MSDTFATSTTHATFLPTVWAKDAMIARQSTLVMAELCQRYDLDVAGYGQVINIPFVDNLLGGNISTSTGQLDAESPTEPQAVITINQWKGVRMKVLDIVLAQSKYPFRRLYMDRMGYRLGQILEQYLLAFAPKAAQPTATSTDTSQAGTGGSNSVAGSGPFASVGTYTQDLQDADYRRAVQYEDDTRVPFPDRHMILCPAQKNAILGIDKFIRYDATGERNLVSVGRCPGEIYGIMAHISPEVSVSGSNTSNLLFHRDFLGLAMQKDIKLEQFARVGWLDDLGGSELFGASVLRNDHAVELRS